MRYVESTRKKPKKTVDDCGVRLVVRSNAFV